MMSELYKIDYNLTLRHVDYRSPISVSGTLYWQDTGNCRRYDHAVSEFAKKLEQELDFFGIKERLSYRFRSMPPELDYSHPVENIFFWVKAGLNSLLSFYGRVEVRVYKAEPNDQLMDDDMWVEIDSESFDNYYYQLSMEMPLKCT